MSFIYYPGHKSGSFDQDQKYGNRRRRGRNKRGPWHHPWLVSCHFTYFWRTGMTPMKGHSLLPVIYSFCIIGLPLFTIPLFISLPHISHGPLSMSKFIPTGTFWRNFSVKSFLGRRWECVRKPDWGQMGGRRVNLPLDRLSGLVQGRDLEWEVTEILFRWRGRNGILHVRLNFGRRWGQSRERSGLRL